MSEVARAADVSDQTVYNYFPAKTDLVLDRADEFVALFGAAIRERASGSSPAAAIRLLVDEDIDRYRGADLRIAHGEFPALCARGGTLRRFSLELRERQTTAVAEAIVETDPTVAPLVARAHAAALVAIVQAITDRIGSSVLVGDVSESSAGRDAPRRARGVPRPRPPLPGAHRMKQTRVLISGASIGGPALAYWLHRYGFDVTVVEKAHQVRGGGQAVDFKGPIHMRVLGKMGILDAVRAASEPNADGAIVNAAGRRIGTVPGAFGGGELNIPRGELARILHGLTADTVEYVFDDSITALTETDDAVEVDFVHAAPRTFDIVVGADGMHSNVRRLAFGPESDYVRHLGHSYVLATIDAGDEDVMYNEPGRMAALGGGKAPAFLVFASDGVSARDDVAAQKQQVVDAYRGGAWRLPELMAKLPGATDFYLDSISRATVDRWSRGRVVLVGDAAYGNALGGFGTGLALVGASVLAGELLAARGDHTVAFAAYQAKFRGYASVSQKVNAGRILAPGTRWGIRLRNLLFGALTIVGPLMKVVDRPASNLALEDYERFAPAPR